MEQGLITKVWQMDGLFGASVPGLLILKESQVSLVTPEGIQFSVPLSELKELKWPFIRFGLGFNTVVNGKKYYIIFGKPDRYSDELDDTVLYDIVRIKPNTTRDYGLAVFLNFFNGREGAKHWKPVLRKRNLPQQGNKETKLPGDDGKN